MGSGGYYQIDNLSFISKVFDIKFAIYVHLFMFIFNLFMLTGSQAVLPSALTGSQGVLPSALLLLLPLLNDFVQRGQLPQDKKELKDLQVNLLPLSSDHESGCRPSLLAKRR